MTPNNGRFGSIGVKAQGSSKNEKPAEAGFVLALQRRATSIRRWLGVRLATRSGSGQRVAGQALSGGSRGSRPKETPSAHRLVVQASWVADGPSWTRYAWRYKSLA